MRKKKKEKLQKKEKKKGNGLDKKERWYGKRKERWLKERWLKVYGPLMQIETKLDPDERLVGRIQREFQRKTWSLHSISSVKNKGTIKTTCIGILLLPEADDHLKPSRPPQNPDF